MRHKVRSRIFEEYPETTFAALCQMLWYPGDVNAAGMMIWHVDACIDTGIRTVGMDSIPNRPAHAPRIIQPHFAIRISAFRHGCKA